MDLEYEVIGPIDAKIEAHICEIIRASEFYEISDELPDGRLNHIVIKETKKPFGHIGRDNLEKVNPNEKSLKPHHKYLERLYQGIINTTLGLNVLA